MELRWRSALAFFDEHGIDYRYVDGPSIGADFGHVWDTWRKHFNSFPPLSFRDSPGHHHHGPSGHDHHGPPGHDHRQRRRR